MWRIQRCCGRNSATIRFSITLRDRPAGAAGAEGDGGAPQDPSSPAGASDCFAVLGALGLAVAVSAMIAELGRLTGEPIAPEGSGAVPAPTAYRRRRRRCPPRCRRAQMRCTWAGGGGSGACDGGGLGRARAGDGGPGGGPEHRSGDKPDLGGDAGARPARSLRTSAPVLPTTSGSPPSATSPLMPDSRRMWRPRWRPARTRAGRPTPCWPRRGSRCRLGGAPQGDGGSGGGAVGSAQRARWWRGRRAPPGRRSAHLPGPRTPLREFMALQGKGFDEPGRRVIDATRGPHIAEAARWSQHFPAVSVERGE
jgi:hypothetical protein